MLKRLIKHLSSPGWWARRAFRADDLAAITDAVRRAERQTRCEIRIAIEASLPLGALLGKRTSRERAGELFQTLGVANTREANGILIYVQLVDRQVEILADRGIARGIAADTWTAICHTMEMAFAACQYRAGMLEAIRQISDLLTEHFPANGDNPNELDDAPKML